MREVLAIQYYQQDDCPLCEGSPKTVGMLDRCSYYFGVVEIRYPNVSSIPLYQCQECHLLFKKYVPLPSEMSMLINQYGNSVWKNNIKAYYVEAEFTKKYFQGNNIDILDVGGSYGAMLKPFDSVPGKRTILDVNKTIKQMIDPRYDFRHGLIDSDVECVEDRYDLVCAIDVIEHLNYPKIAIENISSVTKDNGYVFFHTAELCAMENQEVDLSGWWYINLFEHNIAWTRKTIEEVMKSNGFYLVAYERLPNKMWNYCSIFKKCGIKLLTSLQRFEGVSKVARDQFNKDLSQLSVPFVNDHMSLIFKKSS